MDIQLNNETTATVELLSSVQAKLDGKEVEYDLLSLGEGVYNLLLEEKSYSIMVQDIDKAQKTIELTVNGLRYHIKGKDKYDSLLESLGMNLNTNSKLKELKAPMPGLVLELCVQDGQQVKEGDPLVILEAMKMENVLKAPQEGTVRVSGIEIGQVVEKGEVLLRFED